MGCLKLTYADFESPLFVSASDFSGCEKERGNWYEMYYRGYDPAIGRMLQVDPYAVAYASHTTYNYALNNPVYYNDPNGGQTQAPPGTSESSWNRIQRNSNRNNPDYFSDWAYDFGTDRMDAYVDAEAVRNGSMSMDSYVSKYRESSEGANALLQAAFGKGELTVNGDGSQYFSYPVGWVVDQVVEEIDEKGRKWTTTYDHMEYVFIPVNAKLSTLGISGGFDQLFNAGATIYGTSELGLQILRNNGGAKALGRVIGFGTQRQAAALRGTLGMTSKVGQRIGTAGYIFSAASIGYKYATGQHVSTAENVGFGISTALVGAAWLTAGTAAAPFVAGGALVYGVAELGSYMFTGQTLEEHIFGN